MTMLFDRVAPENIRITDDGYLVGEAKVARTGIQEYLAVELGMTDRNPSDVIRVYRPEDEVFSTDTMRGYAYRPVTVDHPNEMVTSDNWKQYAAGQTGPDVVRDGEFVRVPLVLMDSNAINQWQSGKRELSMGYTSEIEFADGVTPAGEKYDAVQRNLKMNHLALVAKARGGSTLKLGDNTSEDLTMSDKLKIVLVDGLSVETTDAGAQAIDKLQKQVTDARKEVTDAEAAHKEAIAIKDKEIATKDAEIDALKAKQLTDADLDKAVNERADLISVAKTIADKDYTGKSATEIRKLAVTAKLGDSAIADKSDDYVAARFDILAEDAAKDPVRRTMQGRTTSHAVNDNGYAESVASLQPGYKPAEGGH